MKKLIVGLVLSVFAFTSAAYACDGMKGHEKGAASDTQAKKDTKKGDATKSDTKS